MHLVVLIYRLVHFIFVWGENVHKAIFAAMKKLVTKEVALCYSGEGRKGKKAFISLPVYMAITSKYKRIYHLIVYYH